MHQIKAQILVSVRVALQENDLPALSGGKYILHARGMRQVKGLEDRQIGRTEWLCAALILLGASVTGAAEGARHAVPKLKPVTEAAFDRYVHLTDERNTAELKQGSPFLEIDAFPEQERRDSYESLRAGTARIEKRQTKDAGREI